MQIKNTIQNSFKIKNEERNMMRSFVGTRVKVLNENTEKTGMVSSVKGEKIFINIGITEVIEAPLDDVDIYKASPEDGVDFIIEW